MKIKQENSLSEYMKRVNEAKIRYILEGAEYRKKMISLKKEGKKGKNK